MRRFLAYAKRAVPGRNPGTARLFGFRKVQARRRNRPDRKLIGAVGAVNFLILGKLSGVHPHRAEFYVPACFQYLLAKIGRYPGKIRPVCNALSQEIKGECQKKQGVGFENGPGLRQQIRLWPSSAVTAWELFFGRNGNGWGCGCILSGICYTTTRITGRRTIWAFWSSA